MATRKVILGIGNIGREYQGTRHNLGFDVVDGLAERNAARFDTRKWNADLCQLPAGGALGPDPVLLVKPRTYVNRSGVVAQAVLAFFKLPPEQLLVVVDDLNLSLGHLRLRGKGSAGGHNGLRDIERCLGQGYPRLRLGIKSPRRQQQDQVGFVLGRFSPDEQADADGMRRKAMQCCEAWLKHGLDAAMACNGPLHPPEPTSSSDEASQPPQ
ncbi:MAG: aminoacyl-tRNA hydrolase [Planctomycetota bacterium]